MRGRVALLMRDLPLPRGAELRLFFAGQLISQIGNWLTLLAQALLVLKLTNRGVAVGLLTGCRFAPVLLLGPWAGLIADRSKRRLRSRPTAWRWCSRAAWRRSPSSITRPSVPCTLAVVGGIATAFDSPARRSFVNELVGGRRPERPYR